MATATKFALTPLIWAEQAKGAMYFDELTQEQGEYISTSLGDFLLSDKNV